MKMTAYYSTEHEAFTARGETAHYAYAMFCECVDTECGGTAIKVVKTIASRSPTAPAGDHPALHSVLEEARHYIKAMPLSDVLDEDEAPADWHTNRLQLASHNALRAIQKERHHV